MTESTRILVGAIAGAHGVHGEVTIKTFTADPASIAAYGPLSDAAGARLKVKARGMVRGLLIARIDGVKDRNAAEALKGTQLFVERAALPEPAAEEFYRADLEGATVEDVEGRPVGTVRAVHNYGAGDILEIERPGGAALWLAFTRRNVPVVDVKTRRLVVVPPEEVEAPPEAPGPSGPHPRPARARPERRP